MTRSTTRVAAWLAIVAMAVGACGSSIAPPSQAASGDANQPDASPADFAQIGAPWQATPLALSDAQVATVSDACATAARTKLGPDEAELPTAVTDARGLGLVTAILSDDDLAVECDATLDAAGQATAGVGRMAVTAYDPQDGTALIVTELRDGGAPGDPSVAFGRVGPGASGVRIGLADGSTVSASTDSGWWAAWWPGPAKASTITSLDGSGATAASIPAPSGGVESTVAAASWWLVNPADAGKPDASTIPIWVRESECASGGTGGLERLDPPDISLDDTTIVVTLAIRRLPGAQDCQSNPPFRFDLDLPEPIGGRKLLDGSSTPPRDATQPAP